MKIGVASDHRGFNIKNQTLMQIQQLGHTAVDCGPDCDSSCDYPDYAARVAEQVSTGELDSGVLICGTGLGMCIAANKFPGVRAVPCHDLVTVQMARRHNDANILCLSADLIGNAPPDQLIATWISTDFEGGRHARRVDKIRELESRNGMGSVKSHS